jgi:isopenicillin-N epimerase
MGAYNNNTMSYKAFGSFFSDNVQHMLENKVIRASRPIHSSIPICEELGDPAKSLFLVDFQRFVFLNHGAFGATLKFLMDEAQEWRVYCEKQPLRFIDREMFSFWCDSLECLARYLRVDWKGLTFVPNATFALNSVVQSVICKGDSVLLLNLAYGATKKIAEHCGGRIEFAEISLPLESEEKLIREICLAAEGKKIKLAIIDHITSNTALLLPVDKICKALKSLGVEFICIDGAHAPGSVDLDISKIDCDFYAGNCHKWLCCNRGVGFIWARNPLFELYPAVASHGILESDLQSRFLWTGNSDYSPILTIPTTIAFWENLNNSFDVIAYRKKLIHYTINQFQKVFGNCNLLLPKSLIDEFLGSMVLVGIPSRVLSHFSQHSAKSIQGWLYSRGFEIPVKFIINDFWLRISFQIYNTEKDIDMLVKLFLDTLRSENFECSQVLVS